MEAHIIPAHIIPSKWRILSLVWRILSMRGAYYPLRGAYYPLRGAYYPLLIFEYKMSISYLFATGVILLNSISLKKGLGLGGAAPKAQASVDAKTDTVYA